MTDMKTPDWHTIKVHPAADQFHRMAPDEFDAFKADVSQRGLVQPVVVIVVDGALWLLDGRHRVDACLALGVPIRFEVVETSDPFGHARSLNEKRRHLSARARGILAARAVLAGDGGRAAKAEGGRRSGRTRRGEDGAKVVPSSQRALKSVEEEAKKVGVCRRYVQDGVAILKDAPDLADSIVDQETYEAANKERMKRVQSLPPEAAHKRASDQRVGRKPMIKPESKRGQIRLGALRVAAHKLECQVNGVILQFDTFNVVDLLKHFPGDSADLSVRVTALVTAAKTFLKALSS